MKKRKAEQFEQRREIEIRVRNEGGRRSEDEENRERNSGRR